MTCTQPHTPPCWRAHARRNRPPQKKVLTRLTLDGDSRVVHHRDDWLHKAKLFEPLRRLWGAAEAAAAPAGFSSGGGGGGGGSGEGREQAPAGSGAA
jgi:uncharacterized membrane protein